MYESPRIVEVGSVLELTLGQVRQGNLDWQLNGLHASDVAPLTGLALS